MNKLIDRIATHCASHSLLLRGETVLIAVSGGVDSIALLDILCKLAKDWDLTLHVAHLNHRLRGEASAKDADFVGTEAARRRLTFHRSDVDCNQVAIDQKCSIEVAARKARIAYLNDLSARIGAQKIATGHHADDQAETVLIRLLRGSGTTGLSGIRPTKDKKWIRPLLKVDRSEIEVYAHKNNLIWRSDASNSDIRIHRNRIRHQLIPILKSNYGSRVPEAIARAAEILQADDDLLESIALGASKTVICAHSCRKIALDEARFFGYHVAIQRRLLRVVLIQLGLDPKRIEFRLINRILTELESGQNNVQITAGLTASLRGRLIILGMSASPFEHGIHTGENKIESIDARLTVDELDHSAFPDNFAEVSSFEIWFDRRAVPRNLTLRTIRPGDKIHPFGLRGSSKISDLLINKKLPRLIRDEIPVLANRDEVYWIVGIRTSEASRINATTKQATRFQFDGSWKRFYTAFERHI
ncbi:MAG: tRNA lysidine(34) synthetase TilS [Candidatus Latescibacterota bacterium]|nr:tRNA lysidine(34) synthetase TilS [Candidatus Latescibacterota bacterium]